MTNTLFRSSYLTDVSDRGFIHQCTQTENLDRELTEGKVVAYIGFDATATSLHVGNLVQIMQLRHLQQHGHKPIVLMGDGTTRIGDPSGKDASRQLLSPEQIEKNVEGIQSVFSKYLRFGDGPSDALMLRNSEWLTSLSYLDFLRDYGRHFSVNRMLSFESVKLRLEREQTLSFLEFNYMIFQAYDFLELNRRYGCNLQLGGSDQWGNIVNGVELTRRVDGKEVYGLTAPLITTADGKKMGKSVDGAIWLNEDMRSPFEFWQFWRNTQDADVGRFLRLYTDLSLSDIHELEALEGAKINEAKIILANETTKLCHGEEAVKQANETAQKLFSKSSQKDAALDLQDLEAIEITEADMQNDLYVVDCFVKLGLTKSLGEARRLIKQGGVKVNDEKITDTDHKLQITDFKIGAADCEGESDKDSKRYVKVSAGKKRHALVKLSS